MATIRKSVMEPMTILGLEPFILAMAFCGAGFTNIIILLVFLNPIVVPLFVVTLGLWWVAAWNFGRRNPDYGSVIAERLNRFGLPVSPNSFYLSRIHI